MSLDSEFSKINQDIFIKIAILTIIRKYSYHSITSIKNLSLHPQTDKTKPSSQIYNFSHDSNRCYFSFPQSIMKSVSAERRKPLTRSSLMRDNEFSLSLLSDVLSYEATLELALLKQIINDFKHIISQQPNLLHIQDPVLVVGDIHGQFYDLMKILKYGQALKDHKRLPFRLLFLGDYVDRGINAVQVMILLMALKVRYPSEVLMLRGNHESRIMTAQYNFRTQCCLKYSQEVYDLMMEAFDLLPIACVVNNSFFCVHGGISDKMMDIKQINGINRKVEIPVENSAYCDFIWSDPVDNERGVLPRKTIYNQSRDCSIVFGHELVSKFLALNDLSTVIRGHQVFLQGFKAYEWGEVKSSPEVITVFSAPNYCGSCGNRGAVLRIQDGTFKIKQFRQEQPQKYKFSVNFNVLKWTLPQIMRNAQEIVLQMMESIVQSHFPELKEVDSERRLQLFVQYAKKEKLVEPIPTASQIKRREMTAQEERNYMFNRSHEYYAQFEKLPKHH